MFYGLFRFDFAPPKIGFMPCTVRKSVMWSLVLAAAATIIQLRSGYLVPVAAPTPPSKTVSVSGDWLIYMPISGDQCWELFPCTAYDFGDKSVESWNNRLFFRPNFSATVACPAQPAPYGSTNLVRNGDRMQLIMILGGATLVGWLLAQSRPDPPPR
jgi:hypothetical protein